MLKPDDFEVDLPWCPDEPPQLKNLKTQIKGVEVQPLLWHEDHRGGLCELLTLRDASTAPIVHVYTVIAAPGSVRAWAFHKHKWDRHTFTQGKFRIVLYDIGEDSPTRGKLDILELGSANPARLLIPPYVVHGMENYGDEHASFVSMPTEIYNPGNPDKYRLPADHPGIPYSFDRD